MKITLLFASLLLPQETYCESIFGFPLPNNLEEIIGDVLNPIEKYLEPYKKIDV